eukprot:scaffold5100_cov110-Skeletonema_marinoi.AAC.8
MLEPCNRCFYTIMANYHGSLEAVDCHIHSVRYDSGLEVSSCGHPQFGNIRSPTMLLFSSVWSIRDYVQIYLEFFLLYSINSLELASRVLDVARIAVPTIGICTGEYLELYPRGV